MKSFLCFCVIIFFFTSCGGKNFDEQSYQTHKETVTDKEKKNPLLFLSVSGNDKKNIIGQTVMRGKIFNKAAVCSYKDVRIKMLCFKDEKMVEEHEDVVSEIVKPNSSVDFKTRYRLPKGTDSIALSVMNAKVVK